MCRSQIDEFGCARPFHRCTSSLGQVAINLRLIGEKPNP
jgi:hypothetical protein